MPEPITPAPGTAVNVPNPPAPGVPEATPPAPGVKGEPGTPPVKEEEKMVPLAALKESRDMIKDLKGQVDALQNAVLPKQQTPSPYGFDNYGHQSAPQQYVQPQHAPQHDPYAPPVDPAAQMYANNPRQAVQREIMMAFDWYDKTNTALDAQIDGLAGDHPDVANYRTDINKYLRTLPPQSRGQKGVAELAYYVVKGQNTDTLVSNSVQETLAKIKAGESVQGLTASTGASTAPVTDVKPSQEEANMAARMNMTVEEYMKHKQV